MQPNLALLVLIAAASGAAHAGKVEVHISNVGPTGPLFVQACTEPELTRGCPHRIKLAPHVGETIATFTDLAPGRYQISAFQDVNDNGRLDFGMMGAPVEPWGYSRDAKPVMGPPAFNDAAVEIGAAPVVVPVRLRK